MNWENFKHQFHESWWNKMQPFIESEECDNIYRFTKLKQSPLLEVSPKSIKESSPYLFPIMNEGLSSFLKGEFVTEFSFHRLSGI